MALKYTLSDTKFINPYNFVPVDFSKNTKTNNVEEKKSDRKTGVIKCSIYTKTPIAILDTSEKNMLEIKKGKTRILHPEYPFMKNENGAYMIPGSTIRGMIRSVYETLTNSCFSTVDIDTSISERVSSETPYLPGVLMREGNTWKLYSADRYKFKVTRKNLNDTKMNKVLFDKSRKEYFIQTAQGNLKVYSGDLVEITGSTSAKGFKALSIANVPKGANTDNKLVGYVVIGENFKLRKGEKSESIFRVKDEVDVPLEAVKKAMAGLEQTLKEYRNDAINKNVTYKGWYPAFERMKENGCIPVWYKTVGEIQVYLSMAAIGRKAFHSTMGNLLDAKAPCEERTHLCDACNLFGMANEKSSTGSRVRFTDAVSDSKAETIKIVLKELGAPRPSYLPFYANVNDENYRAKAKSDYDSKGVTIRGRKYYWHTTNWKEINKDIMQSNLNSTVNALDANEKFTFDIYYDGITEAELDKLVYSLSFWENNADGKLCHKVGHGKPVGLGSIKITVDKVLERTFDKNAGYEIKTVFDSEKDNQKFENDCKYIDESLKTVAALRQIVDFEAVKDERVCYPFIEPNGIEQKKENDFAAHKWFSENDSGKLQDHNHDIQFLPSIEEIVGLTNKEQETLFAYKAEFVPDKPRNNNKKKFKKR